MHSLCASRFSLWLPDQYSPLFRRPVLPWPEPLMSGTGSRSRRTTFSSLPPTVSSKVVILCWFLCLSRDGRRRHHVLVSLWKAAIPVGAPTQHARRSRVGRFKPCGNPTRASIGAPFSGSRRAWPRHRHRHTGRILYETGVAIVDPKTIQGTATPSRAVEWRQRRRGVW
jgi:hypothetical protein